MVIPEFCNPSTTYDKPQNSHCYQTINPISLVLKYWDASGKDIEMDPDKTAVQVPIKCPGKGIKGDHNTVVLDQQRFIRDFKNAASAQLVDGLTYANEEVLRNQYKFNGFVVIGRVVVTRPKVDGCW